MRLLLSLLGGGEPFPSIKCFGVLREEGPWLPAAASVLKRGGLLVNNGFSIGFVADDDDPFLSTKLPKPPPVEFCGVLTGGGGEKNDGKGEAGRRVAVMVINQ